LSHSSSPIWSFIHLKNIPILLVSMNLSVNDVWRAMALRLAYFSSPHLQPSPQQLLPHWQSFCFLFLWLCSAGLVVIVPKEELEVNTATQHLGFSCLGHQAKESYSVAQADWPALPMESWVTTRRRKGRDSLEYRSALRALWYCHALWPCLFRRKGLAEDGVQAVEEGGCRCQLWPCDQSQERGLWLSWVIPFYFVMNTFVCIYPSVKLTSVFFPFLLPYHVIDALSF
jgi:hypothetical protein